MLAGWVIVNATPNRYRLLCAVAWAALVAACGSRSGLLVTGTDEEPSVPQGETPARGNGDAGVPPPDAPISRDALPPVDVSAPPPNTVNDCPDAAATLVYVVSEQNALVSFYPPTATFTTIGTLSCPAPPGYRPFSMAVDRTGIAYVLYYDSSNQATDGQLFRVSTATASCRPTRFSSGQQGFASTFGMAFVRDPLGGGETLYVAEGNLGSGPPAGTCSASARLATIDTNSFTLNIVGAVIPTVCSPELTGTAAGALFGFYSVDPNDSAIGQISPTTARLVSESRLNGVAQGHAWAFAFWGGDFFTFTAPTNSGSTITRFRPIDGSVVSLATTAETIVGAGVSTCAPQQ
jgi:hypothetical protein